MFRSWYPDKGVVRKLQIADALNIDTTSPGGSAPPMYGTQFGQ